MTLSPNIRASLQRNWKALNAAIAIVIDVGVLSASYVMALVLFHLIKRESALPGSHEGFLAVLVVAYIVAFTMLGIYRRITYLSLGSQLYSALRGHLLIAVLSLSTIHFFPGFVPRPAVFLLFVAATPFVYLLVWLIVRRGTLALRRLEIGRANTIAIGSDPDFHNLIHRLNEHADLQFNLVSVVRTSRRNPADRFDHLDVDAVDKLLSEFEIDQIVFSSSYQLNGSFTPLHSLCRDKGIAMRIVSQESDDLFSKVGIRDIAGIPIYVPEGMKIRSMKRVMKRLFDVFVSSILLIALAPLFAVVAIAIKLESRGPVFFRHPRSLGAGDPPFHFLKFRSMRNDADNEKESLLELNESDGALFKIKDDPRLTKVGKIIRKFSIDELPQLVNVLKGEMSLVGPRPLPVKDYDKIDKDDHIGGYLHLRSNVKPGMTGLWQVSGRSHLGFREMVMLDLYYIENQTILFDLEILAQTVPVVVFGRGAY